MDADIDALRADLAASSDVRDILYALVKRPGDIRAWAASEARELLSHDDAVELLLRVAKSRDVDIRDTAIEDLLAFDPLAARRLARRFRRLITDPKEHWDKITGLWSVAAIGDVESLDLVRGVRDDANVSVLARQTAELAELVLLRDENEIVGRLRDGDVDTIMLVAKAARLLRTRGARAALEECALHAPDWRCRIACAEQLPAGIVAIDEPEYEWTETQRRGEWGPGSLEVELTPHLVKPGDVRPVDGETTSP